MEVFLEKENNQPQVNVQKNRRSEKEGLFRFTKDMLSALVMALIAIVYVIQAFKIPTGSMKNSLLIGDFLLGLKFIYGAPVLPFSYKKFPAVTNPKPGDVIIFKYPGTDKKDYIKRCIAGPGQTIHINQTKVFVDGKEVLLPPHGQYIHNGQLDPRITYFQPLKIPKKGDTLIFNDSLSERDFLFFKHIVKQENPRAKISVSYQLYLNGEFSNSKKVILNGYWEVPFKDINFNLIDNWLILDDIINQVKGQLQEQNVTIKRLLFLNNKVVNSYFVKYDNYFMMGDNRDDSMDSRYWGFLNRNFIKAKAFILYFSWDDKYPIWQLPLGIRWDRIGKLILSWDGMSKTNIK
jgi:signal peptidase I